MCSSLYGILDRYRAVRAYNDGDLDTAQQLLEPIFIHNQQDAESAYNLGKIAYKKEKYDESEAYMTEAAQHTQNIQLQIQAYFDTGNAQVKQKKLKEALESYKAVIALDYEHEQAQDMIEQIEKILEQQQKQQDQQKNNENKQQQDTSQNNNNQEQHKGDEQKNQDPHQEKKGQKNDSRMNEDQGGQNRNKQGSESDFGNDEGENEREKAGKKGEQEQQEQQSQGNMSNESKDSFDDDDNESKQDDISEHHDKSTSPLQQQSSLQDIQEEEKKQDGNGKLKDKEELLLSLLEERDAKLVKAMLKKQVKQRMPGMYGQKNW